MSVIDCLRRQHIIKNNKYLYAFTLLNIALRVIINLCFEKVSVTKKNRYGSV